MPTAPTALDAPITARPFRQDDESGVIELLQASFGEWPGELTGVTPAEFFRWKHLDGPNGPSTMVVAEADDAVIGFVAYMQWPFSTGNRVAKALRGVDLAVHPSYRRRGVSLALRTATKFTREINFTWSNPNEASRPGGAKVGRHPVTILPPFVRPSSPGMTLRRAFSGRPKTPRELSIHAEPAARLIGDGPLTSLLGHASHAHDRLSTLRSHEYLRWRYGPYEEYRAVRVEAGGETRGLAIFRCSRHESHWASHICELLVEPDDRQTARRLLRAVRDAAPVDLLRCSFASRAQAASHGFLHVGRGVPLNISRLQRDFIPDPTQAGSWALTIGDLELL
jgi:GNAT superfamily N-acetyltransferase